VGDLAATGLIDPVLRGRVAQFVVEQVRCAEKVA
jgi:hypothetical protein